MMPTGKLPDPNRAGVTLAEIMIVVTIIGLIMAFVAPRIDYEHYQVDGAMQAVSTTLMAAQREAVAKQHNVAVMFDQPTSSLRILHDVDNDNTADPTERIRVLALDDHVLIGRAGAVPLPQLGAVDITFTRMVDGRPAVIFHRNGSASQSGGLYLTSVRADAGLLKHQRDTRALELFRGTGRPEWWRYDGTNWTRGF